MSRLIDDLRANQKLAAPHWLPERHEEKFSEHAQRVLGYILTGGFPVVVIDNVADYYFTGTNQEMWNLEKDFPNLAPPFDAFWMEHRLPMRIHSENGDTDVSKLLPRGGRTGALFLVARPEDVVGEGIPPEARWIYYIELIIDYGLQGEPPQGPHGSMFLVVDGDGRLLQPPHMQSYAPPALNHLMKSIMTWLHPAFLAICFLHCKNVSVDDNRVPKALAKRFHERRGVWPVPYKTLIIEPLKKILRHEGRSAEHGLQRAMHICRGHFKDYRQGRGLFGKYHQIVWQPMLVRGTKGEADSNRRIEVKV